LNVYLGGVGVGRAGPRRRGVHDACNRGVANYLGDRSLALRRRTHPRAQQQDDHNNNYECHQMKPSSSFYSHFCATSFTFSCFHFQALCE
jgi:hypothetical protein